MTTLLFWPSYNICGSLDFGNDSEFELKSYLVSFLARIGGSDLKIIIIVMLVNITILYSIQVQSHQKQSEHLKETRLNRTA